MMWIQIRDNEVDAAIAAFKSNPKTSRLASQVEDERANADNIKRRELIETALNKYGEEGGSREITVDDDAAISLSDAHAFVMMWGYVTFAEADGG